MLADDVTKVMDEQHMLEGQYGDLIAKRSELKGISKKPELLATKKEIAMVATKLKVSTKDLCSKLQDNPDVDGNNMAISNHKGLLIERLTDVKEELKTNLNFTQFKQKLATDMEKAREYDELFEKERKLSKQVKELA